MTKSKRIAALEMQVAELKGQVVELERSLLQLMMKPYTTPQPLPKVTPEWDIPPAWWNNPNMPDPFTPRSICVSSGPETPEVFAVKMARAS